MLLWIWRINRIPIYLYKHPNTKKVYEIIRKVKDRNRSYISPDGKKCKRIFALPTTLGVIDKNAEVFEKDPDYVKKCRPKYVKFKDGHREKYDPTKHF